MRLALTDLRFCLGRCLRVVGIALTAVTWVSVLGSEAQQGTDVRTLLTITAAVLGVLIAHLFTGLPPSARVPALVRAWQRDITSAAREVVGEDNDRVAEVAQRSTALAIARIERTGRVPHDRRAWLRLVARLAASD